MATAQRVKVRVADLIARIEAKKVEARADYEKAVKKYEFDSESWGKRVQDALSDAHVAAQRGKLPEVSERYVRGSYRTALSVPVKGDKPSKPSRPALQQYDSDIALLKMSTDDIIAVSTEDRWSRYL